ncbi:hypothetical protein DL96DRAFT_1709464 [Flagelloscypha sp. PMI_526]|nr:hypothetical protein DL96DRAFT_1709464 [Flagelloscypha sp. PMI_526]
MPRASHAGEVHFDDAARRDYLTGFHKRKLARTDAARKRAQGAGTTGSTQLSQGALRERAKDNARAVERAYGLSISLPALDGSEDDVQGGHDVRQEDYEDEQVMASVTVEEDFDPQSLLEPSEKTSSRTSKITPSPSTTHSSSIQPTKPKSKKPQKVKYET